MEYHLPTGTGAIVVIMDWELQEMITMAKGCGNYEYAEALTNILEGK